MKTKEQLTKELETLNGWKSIRIPSLLGFFTTKKAFKRYTNADWKGIADAITLRTEEHKDFHYAVVAFSIKGTIPQDVLQVLTERVNEFPLGSVRYEASGNGGFYPIYTDGEGWYMEDYEIHKISEDFDGIYITVFSTCDKEKLNCPYIIYAHFEGTLYKYHVDQRFL